MPGMSPRIKAKKGRFGAGGLTPLVEILTPLSGVTVARTGSPLDSGAVFDVTARARDDSGDLTSSITWSSNVDGGSPGVASGTGGSVTLTLVTVGNHVITATASDGTKVGTDTINVTVT